MLLILLGILVTCIVLLWIYSSPFYWKRKGVPYLFPLPIFGSNLPALLLPVSQFFDKLYSNFPNEKYFGFHFFMKPTILIKDPVLIKEICIKDFEYFTSTGMYSNEDDPFSENVSFLHGQAWKEIRSLLTSHFTPMKLRNIHDYVGNTIEKAYKTIENRMSKNEPIRIEDITMGITVDVIVQAVLGIESDSFEENSQFLNFSKKIFSGGSSARLLMGIVAPRANDFFKFHLIDKELTMFLKNVIEDVLKYRENNDISNQDFIGSMMKLMKNKKDNDNNEKYFADNTKKPEYNFKTMFAQALILIGGGTESSAMTMAFFLYEAALNQEIQDKCRDEIMAVVNETGTDIRPEDVNKLTYLDMALKETIRKYPPFLMLTRKCTKQYKMPDSNVIIDPGTLVLMLTKNIQWDPRNYPDPEVFTPDRFKDKSTVNDGKYIAFGLGPRFCLGMNFAKMEMNLVLSRFLRKYRFTLSPKTKVPIKINPNGTVPTPFDGIWMDIEPLNIS